ncbi:MAG: hypothetical protein U0527_13530 [Candidatus Eisenbacteria bacterium]
MTQMEWLLETVRWRDGALRILDQRALPEAESYLELREIADVIEAIRSLAVRGAPAIGVAGPTVWRSVLPRTSSSCARSRTG